MLKYGVFATLLLGGLVLLSACGKSEEVYGSGVDPDLPVVTVQEANFQPELLDTQVTMEGFIQSQCATSGCWFVLRDYSGQIFVDLSRHDFTLPEMGTRDVIASGKLITFNNNLMLEAHGVVVK
ncbi:DNA-binding protein [Desulfurispira natronophila]|uniref:Uncharacterized protein YdeI (BOF family) n=1 Tax=Desulfurispira natronophila TaxID=682562 RepID=A0A7W8DGN6_9BACT|nr:DNA-binding protein [Desulfurispira natronophila]MBB5021557.1 uncharacterized protein YdeI (BOF family) [Desulfurispira natronophila]